jgi:hypothetical protein
MCSEEVGYRFVDKVYIKPVRVVISVKASERVLCPIKVDVVVVFFGGGRVSSMKVWSGFFYVKDTDVVRKDSIEGPKEEWDVRLGGCNDVCDLATGMYAGIGSTGCNVYYSDWQSKREGIQDSLAVTRTKDKGVES